MNDTVRAATTNDAHALAAFAAITFPLSCPPNATAKDVAAHIGEHLSAQQVAAYLFDPLRAIMVTVDEATDALTGYTMLNENEPTEDVAAVISIGSTVELSKFYVHPAYHGSGIARTLMAATLRTAIERGLAGIWLGVNNHNERAHRFYLKQHFVDVGTRHYRLGDSLQSDFVMERPLLDA